MNKIFTFQENAVTFQIGTTTFVNATEMAKPFGKSPKDFLKNKTVENFLTTLSGVRRILLTDLVKQPKRGQRSGTWMHEDVALEFARWLSPEFGIWCNDRIKEILTGKIQSNNSEKPKRRVSSLSLLPASVDNVAELARLEEENRKLTLEVEKLRTQVEPTFKISDIAEELGMTTQELCYRLRQIYVLAWDRDSGKHIIHWQLQGNGFTKLAKKTYRYRSGIVKEFTTWEWTQKGRNFIIDRLKGKDTDKYFAGIEGYDDLCEDCEDCEIIEN